MPSVPLLRILYIYQHSIQAEDLGLQNDIIAVSRKSDAARNRFIYANNTLHALPSSKYSSFRFKLCWFTCQNSDYSSLKFKIYWCTLPNSEYSSSRFKMYWYTMPNSIQALDLRCIGKPCQIVSIQALNLRSICTLHQILVVRIPSLDLRCIGTLSWFSVASMKGKNSCKVIQKCWASAV